MAGKGDAINPQEENFPSQEEGLSEERKKEIAEYFSQNAGLLTQEYLDDLKHLEVREVFNLLVSNKPEFFGFAIDLMINFPNPETIKFLTELRENPEYSKRAKNIDWILFQFAHNPESSEEAINTLKKLNDPRVISETDKGKIELSTQSAFSEVAPFIPEKTDNDWLLKCFKEGAVFTLRAESGDLACVAIAHQYPDYSLYLDYIHTAKDRRKQGYAKDIMEYLLKHQVVLQCDLFRGNMLSEKLLKELNFKHEGPGDKWVYRVPEAEK